MKGMPLTERQRNLLRLIQQLNQNLLTSSENLTSNSLVDLGIDFNLDLNIGGSRGGNGTPPVTPPGAPSSMRELFTSLLQERVEITVPFGILTGTVISVQNDYVVLISDTGEQELVRYENIESVNAL